MNWMTLKPSSLHIENSVGESLLRNNVWAPTPLASLVLNHLPLGGMGVLNTWPLGFMGLLSLRFKKKLAFYVSLGGPGKQLVMTNMRIL